MSLPISRPLVWSDGVDGTEYLKQKTAQIRSREDFELAQFLQRLLNRKQLGGYRYGDVRRSQRYMTRLLLEAMAYKRKGNAEQLLNIAVYAFLESYAPENPKFHFNPHADSVTRRKLGGSIA